MPMRLDDARAVVLATAINSMTPASIVDLRVDVPAIYATARNYRPPLDLDANVFRYSSAQRAVRRAQRGRNPSAHRALCTARSRVSRPRSGSR
jgi:hypothetical protein